MDINEAIEWLRGERSMTNIIPQDPFATWQVRIAEADANMVRRAYYVAKAHREGLIAVSKERCNACCSEARATRNDDQEMVRRVV